MTVLNEDFASVYSEQLPLLLISRDRIQNPPSTNGKYVDRQTVKGTNSGSNMQQLDWYVSCSPGVPLAAQSDATKIEASLTRRSCV